MQTPCSNYDRLFVARLTKPTHTRNVHVNHLLRAHTFNPTMTMRFRRSLLPRIEGF